MSTRTTLNPVLVTKHLLTVLHHELQEGVEKIAQRLSVDEATVLNTLHEHKINIFFDRTVPTQPVVTTTPTETPVRPTRVTKTKVSTSKRVSPAVRAVLLNTALLKKKLAASPSKNALAREFNISA